MARATDIDSFDDVDLPPDKFRQLLRSHGVTRCYAKELAINDNSKQQVYFGMGMEVLNVLPIGEVRPDETPGGSKTLKASIPLHWMLPDGSLAEAPHTQAIVYPQYPEVRMSGFLKGARSAPSRLMTSREKGRWLLLAVTNQQVVVAWAARPDSALARHMRTETAGFEKTGIFWNFPLSASGAGVSSQSLLFGELLRIHQLGWIMSKRLRSDGAIAACEASNCVGYTLEAELGIAANGRAGPDWNGWEVKASLVDDMTALAAPKTVTLMTPEPTGGIYKSEGPEAFVRRFGYADKHGRPDRLNFGGIYKIGRRHPETRLVMAFVGYNAEAGKITDAAGRLVLLDDHENVAVEWSFGRLLDRWKDKHAQVVFVPAEERGLGARQYRYGSIVTTGIGTDFLKFLSALADGDVYFDPGMKLEQESTGKPKPKKRSQFRVNSKNLARLYSNFESHDFLG